MPSVAHFLGHRPLEPHFGQHLNAVTSFVTSAIYYALAVCSAPCRRDSSELLFPALRRSAGRGPSALLEMGWCRRERQSLGAVEMECESGHTRAPVVPSRGGFKEGGGIGLQSAEE